MLNDIIPQKSCNVCEQNFPATTEFWHKNKAGRYGLHNTCKACAKARTRQWNDDNREYTSQVHAAYYQENAEHLRAKARGYYWADPEKARAEKRDYYLRNRESCDARNRQWALNHPERMAQIKRDYLKRHPERRKKSSLDWRNRNLERANQMAREYRKNNPEKSRLYHQLRRARELEAEGSFTAEDVRIAYRSQRGKCWHCGKHVDNKYHADHLVPLAKGGTNYPNNIVVSCSDCNLSKGAKFCYQWNGRLF